VEAGSAGDEAGIRRGDIILEVDRKAVRNVDEYKKAVAGSRKGRGVLFLVRRGDSTIFLALKPQRCAWFDSKRADAERGAVIYPASFCCFWIRSARESIYL